MILFDLEATQPNSSGKRHGGGKYGEAVFGRILQRGLPVSAFYDSTKWLNPQLEQHLLEDNIPLFDVNTIDLDNIISSNNIDLLYTPLLTSRTRNISKCKVLTTVHGLRGYELPTDTYRIKYAQERNVINFIMIFLYQIFPKLRAVRMQSILKHVDFIKDNIDFVTVSYHSAFSINTFFPKNNFDVNKKVFYSPSTINLKIHERKFNKKYFLMVSANRWEKNNLRAIIALDRLFSAGSLQDYEVIVTGAKSIKEFKCKIKNISKFMFLGYVDDDELSQLYHDAYCFIFPSLNEGFGYPPIEAMHYGVPVIASPFSSIQEVCQSAALYVNPFSITEIMNRVLMLTNEKIWSKYSICGRERAVEIKKQQDRDLDRLIDYIYTRLL